MGFGDIVDAAGHALGSVAGAAERLTGEAMDDGAQLVGSGLDAMGLHSAGHAVERFGDAAADRLGATVAEKQLDQSDDPRELIHGSPQDLAERAVRIRHLAAVFGDVVRDLERVDVDHWSGAAADGFRRAFADQPARWSRAQHAWGTAALAIEDYGHAVAAAQELAAQAVTLYRRGVRERDAALSDYMARVRGYEAAVAAQGGNAGGVADPGPFVDPGRHDIEEAVATLERGRRGRDTAAGTAGERLRAAADAAPPLPSAWQQRWDWLTDSFGTTGTQLLHFEGGVLKGAADIVQMVGMLNPLDARNLAHPLRYLHNSEAMAQGLLHAVRHPMELVHGLVGTGWSTDPAEALGHLVPNIVLGLATDGGGTAAEMGVQAAERAGLAAAEQAVQRGGVAAAEQAVQRGGVAAAEQAVQRGGTALAEGPTLDASLTRGGTDGWTPGPAIDPARIPPWESGSSWAPAEPRPPWEPAEPRPPWEPAEPRPPWEPGSSADATTHGARVEPPMVHEPVVHEPVVHEPVAHEPVVHRGTDGGAADTRAASTMAEHHVAGRSYYADSTYSASADAHASYLAPREMHAQTILSEDLAAASVFRSQHPWAEAIPDAELVSLRDYTGTGYRTVNEALRNGDVTRLDKLDPTIQTMASAVNKLQPYEGTVLRSININDGVPAALERYQVGEVVQEPSFVSATSGSEYYSGNVRFEIESKTGGYIGELSRHAHESEVIFGPGTRFHVTAKEYDPSDQRWLIRMSEIPR